MWKRTISFFHRAEGAGIPEDAPEAKHPQGDVCRLTVKGMDCAACSEKIEKTLAGHKGISRVTVYLGAGKVDVLHDPSLVNRNDIEKMIRGIGYRVAQENDGGGQRAALSFDLLRIGVVLALIVFSFAGFGRKWDIIAALIAGYPLFKKALLDLKGKTVTADVFMALGVSASAATGEFRTAAVIAFFMLIAELLDTFTLEKSRKAIRDLVDMAPKTARVRRNGHEMEVPVEIVQKGDIVIVKPGEKIPVEGIIVSGRGYINQAPITGESLPVEKKEGESVYAATINQHGVLFIRVTHTGEDTTYARIIKLVEEAESSKASVQKVADRFASYFTPLILGIAALTFLLTWKVTNAIAVLVVACPCTVAIATPLAVVAGMGKAARRGIIIKGGRYLEALAKVDTIVMDKTGTLTIGDPVVTDIRGFSGFSDEEVISCTAGTERYSEHPLAKAIMKKALETGVPVPDPDYCKILPGMGVEAAINGRRIVLGNRDLLRDKSITISHEVERYIADREEEGKTVLILSSDGTVCGVVCVADVIRDGTVEAIRDLRDLGFHEPLILTGDNPSTAQSIASSLGIKHVMSRLLPEDKVNQIKDLVAKGRRVLMVGDGINDAPALAQAHVGVAMGAVGSDAAIEASDVALMRDEWRQVPEAIRIGRSTFAVIKQNLALGIVFNVVGISLASVGVLSPAMAAVAHIMPDVLVFLNSSRLLR